MLGFLALTLILFLITIDNALLCGVSLYGSSKKLRKTIAAIVATIMGTTQSFMAIGIGALMGNQVFRISCVVILIWMCYRTVRQHSMRKKLEAFRTTVSVLLITMFGSIGNIIWLGIVHNGSYVAIILLSICSIPLFIVSSLFFADQAEKSTWFLYMGTFLMAWIAASLCIETTIGRAITKTMPPLIVQLLFSALIMLITMIPSRYKNLN